jgi:AraC-like DNA-binding protein
MTNGSNKAQARGEQIEVWRAPHLNQLELRRGTEVTAPYPRHWHEEYQLCLIQAGGGELDYRRATHATPTGSLFIVHPGEAHANHTRLERGCSFRSLYLQPELMRQAAVELAERQTALPFFPTTIISERQTLHSYLELHRVLETPSTWLEQEARLADFLQRLVTRYAEIPPTLRKAGQEQRAVQQVREYLTEHYAENISLQQLAQLAGLSPFHLNRVFRAACGLPPHAFQTQVRIARAKTMLRQGDSIAQVASQTGFADQSHFTRHFKRLMMLAPGQYQNSKNVQDSARQPS